MGKKCKVCLEVKPLTDYYQYGKHRKTYAHCKSCHKKRSRFDQYKTTEDKMLELLRKQKYRCCICNSNISNRYCIDHNHKTKEIRGLLCYKCNMGLGKFGDRIDLLSKAIVFLYERGSYGIQNSSMDKKRR